MSSRTPKRTLRLSDLRPEPVDWLWPGRVAAGKVMLIDGDPSQGKSLLTLDLAARLTFGRELPDGHVPTGPLSVVLVGSEDDLRDTVLPRLAAARADLGRVHAFAGRSAGGAGDRPPVFPDDVGLLCEAVEETSARLVIVDPLAAYLRPGVSGNDALVRRALAPLVELAERTRAAVVLVRHLNKGGRGQQAIYRGGGSIALIGVTRTAFLVGPDPEDPELHVLACTKNNLGWPPPSLAFRIQGDEQGRAVVAWAGVSDLSADELVLTPSRRYGGALHGAKEFLRGLLEEGPCGAEEVCRRAGESGIAERTLRRAKAELGVTSVKPCDDGAGWVWQLPGKKDEDAVETWGPRHGRELAEAQEESTRFLEELRAKYRGEQRVDSRQ
jgi:hypothetical protein